MTKFKEITKQLESLKERCESMQEIYDCADFAMDIKAIDTAVEVLGNLPTVEAEPIRHGRNVTTMNPADYFVCSECGIHLTDYLSVEEDDTRCEYIMKYCPNCGAKMDLEE